MVRDVAAFTLLLSPDAIDFGKPVVVTVNGKQVFSGAAKKDPVVMARGRRATTTARLSTPPN